MPSSARRPAPDSETPSKTTVVFTIFNGLILQHCPEHNTMHTARVVARRGRVRDIKVDGREAPIRAATGCPLGRGAHACHGVSQRSLTVAASMRRPSRVKKIVYEGQRGFRGLAP